MARAGAAASLPMEREASMATWVARASTKGSGQTSFTARRLDEDGPSKSPPLCTLLGPAALALWFPSWDEEDDEVEGEDMDNNGEKRKKKVGTKKKLL